MIEVYTKAKSIVLYGSAIAFGLMLCKGYHVAAQALV